jgi:hypothetical protein
MKLKVPTFEVGGWKVGSWRRRNCPIRDVFKDQSRVIKQLNKDRKIERFRSKRKSERSVRDINLMGVGGGVYLTEAMTEGE